MNKSIIALLLIIAILSVYFHNVLADNSIVPVIVLFKEKPSTSDINWIKSIGGEITINYYIINGTAITIPKDRIDLLKNYIKVQNVDPDLEVKALDLNGDAQINADKVWFKGDTGNGVPIAILDTGIDFSHSEFSGRILKCHSEISKDPKSCKDENGH